MKRENWSTEMKFSILGSNRDCMKVTKKKENKVDRKTAGITLIALVVTIIVLLILAGVTISLVVGNNGVITRARETQEVTRGASVEEQVSIWKLDKEAARLKGESYDAEVEEVAMIDRLEREGLLKVEETVKLKDTANNPNRNITIGGKDISFKLETANGGTTPDIPEPEEPTPEGPAYVGTDLTHKEGTIEEGYVVTDGEGNEYVWVPVENPIAETEAEINTMIAEGKYPMAVKTSGTDSKGRQNYRGVLYNFSLDTTVSPNVVKVTPIVNSANGYREPAYLPDSTNGDASANNTVGITATSIQEEYNEMVERVVGNKGFYIARYEASYNSATTKIESKPNTIPMTGEDNSQMWYGMYAKQKGTVGKMIRNMIWGSQYDQVMIMMKDVANPGKSKPFYILNSIDMGNYSGSRTNTGINSAYCIKNICDLAGNMSEWTMEAYASSYRTGRGGVYDYYGSFDAATVRYYGNSILVSNRDGSRFTLY